MAKIFASKHGYSMDANQELLAQVSQFQCSRTLKSLYSDYIVNHSQYVMFTALTSLCNFPAEDIFVGVDVAQSSQDFFQILKQNASTLMANYMRKDLFS